MDPYLFKTRIIKLGLPEEPTGAKRLFVRIQFSGPPQNAWLELQTKATAALGDAGRDVTSAKYSFTYFDREQDHMMLLGNSDLLDAMKAANGNLHIFMERQSTPPPPPTTVVAVVDAATNTATAKTEGNDNFTPPETATSVDDSPPATTTTNFQDTIHEPHDTIKAPPAAAGAKKEKEYNHHHPPNPQLLVMQLQTVVDGLMDVVSTATIALSNQVQQHMKANKNKTAHRSHGSQPCRNVPVAPSRPEDDAAVPVVQTATETSGPDPPQTDATASDPLSDTTKTPFIHGRHTCDGCLTTPIVGLRYHAINMPDYDLCAACRDNYKGDEIQFLEGVESACDQLHQERWRFRLDRGHNGPWNRRRHHPVRNCGSSPRFDGPSSRRPRLPRVACHQLQPPYGFDLALAEAVRRSLAVTTPTNQGDNEHVSLDEETRMETAETSLAAEPASAETEVTPVATPSAPVATDGLDEVPMVVEPEIDLLVFEESAPTTAQTSNPGIVHGVPVALATSPHPTTPQYVTVTPSAPTEDEVHLTAHEDSFADDAAGNGDVAAVLGNTLDLFARAINEVNSELFRMGEVGSNTIILGESESTEKDEEEDTVEVASHASWSVVDEEEQLARATQAIGSALSNSDMENVSAMSHPTLVIARADSKSASSSSSSASSVTSVPTDAPTLISIDRTCEARSETSSHPVPAIQLERWALQLSGLHELGIMNDILSVDILERLNAANIGVDSTDEVTVEQVVNELMKDW